MKWLVQEILNNSSNIIRISNALEKCSVDYLLVRVNKDNSLSVIDKDKKIPLDNSKKVIQTFISNEQIMIYGSKVFAKIAKDMELQPGSFMTERFEFEVFLRELGNELLNNEIIIGELSTLYPIAEKFFIRPTGNTKLFSGMTVTKKDFLDWQERENKEGSPYIGQALMIAPLQRIKVEYRFFVVNQKVITGSSYKVGNKLDSSRKPSAEIVRYAEQIVDKFQLAKAFVIDVAETDKGLKVVEYNNINTSGLYGCDEVAFVRAINELESC
ncbi:ATP-grasp domain-containing protein [Lysinibacillus sphaericus]|uniref:ATP-grasp domain-containing protein n=1 Tax=Lysinibacillus sphaericus TaxID=1421 RepID=UPI003F7AD0CF